MPFLKHNETITKSVIVFAIVCFDSPLSNLFVSEIMELKENGREMAKLHKRRHMSKYDSVKVYGIVRHALLQKLQVYVWFDGSPSHSYVLSRYLVARLLTMSKIPYAKAEIFRSVYVTSTSYFQAVKISLRLKKQLVDQNLLDISQVDDSLLFFMDITDRQKWKGAFSNKCKPRNLESNIFKD